MAYSARILPNYTYEDYLQWEGRWEILEGIPHAKSPMPSPRHQEIAGKVHALFLAAVEAAACDCKVYQPIDLKISEHTIVNPDLLIVCQPIEKSYLDFPPALVAEILSPATRLKDRHNKFDLYERFGIPYYLILDPDAETIEVFQLQTDDRYRLLEETPVFEWKEGCRITVSLDDIWR